MSPVFVSSAQGSLKLILYGLTTSNRRFRTLPYSNGMTLSMTLKGSRETSNTCTSDQNIDARGRITLDVVLQAKAISDVLKRIVIDRLIEICHHEHLTSVVSQVTS